MFTPSSSPLLVCKLPLETLPQTRDFFIPLPPFCIFFHLHLLESSPSVCTAILSPIPPALRTLSHSSSQQPWKEVLSLSRDYRGITSPRSHTTWWHQHRMQGLLDSSLRSSPDPLTSLLSLPAERSSPCGRPTVGLSCLHDLTLLPLQPQPPHSTPLLKNH